MIVLQCQRFPYLKLALKKADGGRVYRRFEAGTLRVEDDDPLRQQILDMAQRDPLITIHEDVLTCPRCGQTFMGAGAKGRWAAHAIDVHEGEDLEPRVHDEARKAAAAFVCDVCSPAQPFASQEELAAHTSALHAARPVLSGDGETVEVGGPKERPQVVKSVPAATRRRQPAGAAR